MAEHNLNLNLDLDRNLNFDLNLNLHLNQMAEGLCFGIVPSVSRPALGVVSGMVGAGGNAGSLITNAAFFINGR
jgi:nitrate/nitrite transporter NarK